MKQTSDLNRQAQIERREEEIEELSGTVVFRGPQLLDKYGTSIYAAVKKGDSTYPTVHRYLSPRYTLTNFTGPVLYAILIDGLGFSPEELARMPFGEIFEIVPRREE